jgi:hypothetical protein
MKEAQELSVKKIRKGETLPRGDIYVGKGLVDFREMILKKDILQNPKVIPKDGDRDCSISLRAMSDFTFERNCPYALHLQNEVKLNFDGRLLLYSGAIQPSDYRPVRRIAALERAKKIIWPRIWSKEKKFSAFAFSGGEPVRSPEMTPSKPHQEFKVNYWETVLPEEIIDWDRAKYFTVLADVTK